LLTDKKVNVLQYNKAHTFISNNTTTSKHCNTYTYKPCFPILYCCCCIV